MRNERHYQWEKDARQRKEFSVQIYAWGRNGFDGIVETKIAGRGFSLASLKNGNLKIKR